MNYRKMYIIYAALLFCLYASSSVAQDIIVKQNGEQIQSKVKELTETTIKYLKFKNLDGPIYNINKTEVVTINYENGTIEVIQRLNPTPMKPTIQKSIFPMKDDQNRAENFQFYDKNITASYVVYDEFKGFSLEYEERVFSDDFGLKIPLYIVFKDGVNIISTGLNIKYYLYENTWLKAFVGPEINVGYLQDENLERLDLEVINLQVLGDVGISLTPIDRISITPHVGFGYGSAFLVSNESNRSVSLASGFTFNFNIGIGYHF